MSDILRTEIHLQRRTSSCLLVLSALVHNPLLTLSWWLLQAFIHAQRCKRGLLRRVLAGLLHATVSWINPSVCNLDSTLSNLRLFTNSLKASEIWNDAKINVVATFLSVTLILVVENSQAIPLLLAFFAVAASPNHSQICMRIENAESGAEKRAASKEPRPAVPNPNMQILLYSIKYICLRPLNTVDRRS